MRHLSSLFLALSLSIAGAAYAEDKPADPGAGGGADAPADTAKPEEGKKSKKSKKSKKEKAPDKGAEAPPAEGGGTPPTPPPGQ
jgi:hypothetical protein